MLPFENLGADPENAYFADGIQQEILSRLSKIADLKVISRASTQRYQSKPRNLADIAKELGVENVLEGSVQKSGDQVRVNVQLIKARTRFQLWTETYDRSLTDVFAVEGEIAKRIAESLQGKISGHEEQSLVVKPTSNSEAYDAYLRGLAFEVRSHVPSWSCSADLVWKAIGFYERAVQLDPKFAVAWARLSRLDSFLSFNSFDPVNAARREPAKRALENAQGIERNSAEATLALGYYQYWVLRDYGRAKTTFGRLSKSLPGSSEVPTALGLISRREGNWDQSIAWFEQALALDPRNVELIITAAETYGMHRRFETALRLYDRALDIIPNDPDVMAEKPAFIKPRVICRKPPACCQKSALRPRLRRPSTSRSLSCDSNEIIPRRFDCSKRDEPNSILNLSPKRPFSRFGSHSCNVSPETWLEQKLLRKRCLKIWTRYLAIHQTRSSLRQRCRSFMPRKARRSRLKRCRTSDRGFAQCQRRSHRTFLGTEPRTDSDDFRRE